jgi:hypothetical protein
MCKGQGRRDVGIKKGKNICVRKMEVRLVREEEMIKEEGRRRNVRMDKGRGDFQGGMKKKRCRDGGGKKRCERRKEEEM